MLTFRSSSAYGSSYQRPMKDIKHATKQRPGAPGLDRRGADSGTEGVSRQGGIDVDAAVGTSF